MTGRVKRKTGLATVMERSPGATTTPCWLCERPLGRAVEWHHPVPKSRGGRVTVPIHPICHRTIHTEMDHAALVQSAGERAPLLVVPGIARFLDWIADKPADFRAPVRRSQRISRS